MVYNKCNDGYDNILNIACKQYFKINFYKVSIINYPYNFLFSNIYTGRKKCYLKILFLKIFIYILCKTKFYNYFKFVTFQLIF